MSKGQGTLSRVFGSIFKYQMQRFSWRTCAIRAADATSRVSRGMLPQKIFYYLDSLKCNFLLYLDQNWLNRMVSEWSVKALKNAPKK